MTAESWHFKREIIINNQGGAATDIVIQIKLNSNDFDFSKTKADGADIRFSTSAGRLNDSGLSYWTEQWNENGTTIIWVKVPVLKAKTRNSIFMFYGNFNAVPVSNGDKTFLFFDDFEEGDFTKKWTNTSVGEVIEKEGQLKLKETDGQDGIVTANFNVTGKMIVRTSYQREGADGHWVRAGVGGWNNWLAFGDHTDRAASGTNYVMLFDSSSIGSLKSAPLIKSPNLVITDKWRRAEYWFDGKKLYGKQDDITVELLLKNAASKLALRTLDNDSWDNFAYISVSKYAGSEPKVTLGKEQAN
ncbi:DUF2341 domain-containing protein [Dyadobacter frigoris]|uniref:DUF2341 domain-containing protein n=1 Tax=Dyadobacter frigoris TaxID=2576211 RepID=A0A4U6DD01_9BACT|nr:DUF2341 domain-containing protein [Dyadobacter frigoris]TKT92264.1 DUF2341 domain-containing protein [Dyadobacter frigoris]GLU53444.1 hypothetical protein Dfri01_29050 [Dyadobacter frigoris]